MTSGPQVIAVDLDGTLTDRDCVVRYLIHEIGLVHLGVRLLRSASALVRALVRADRDEVKRILARSLAGKSFDEVERSGECFVKTSVIHWLRSDTLNQIEANRRPGSQVVIVSASYHVYVKSVASMLGFDGAIGTRLEHEGGRLTGRIHGPNCRGREKVVRLTEWMEAAGLDPAETEVIAFGDSSGDDELLEFASTAIRVKRVRRCRR